MKEAHQIDCNFLQVIYLEPFPAARVAEILRGAERTVLIENNATGQLGELIRQKTGLEMADTILQYNGRQFYRDELVEHIAQRLFGETQSLKPGDLEEQGH